ncbi:mannose-1-phosphate guanylyltransferase [Gangjinia marincola]|uniref:Mannose-1-phosphate guanylyltransferase n=1 Tax=Gangjinia marincola TaxID=578463 RepID=A0ABP3XVV9_9FLAO
MNKNYYAVLMAGGVGSRFWPVSRAAFPKQFHDMLGTGETLIQRTYKRLSKIIPPQNILILTNAKYDELVKEQLEGITDQQIILEPAMRNTAPCILLSALKIQKENPDALMVVAPSDHWIEDEAAFVKDIQASFDACQREDMLMTLGITPTFPNTGYGYIQYDQNEASQIKPVLQFTEKPNVKKAEAFIKQGNYLWNAGIFIWSVSSIVQAFQQNLPKMFSLLYSGIDYLNSEKEQEFINSEYPKADNISIDYGIMENAEDVRVLPVNFDWNDLGAWGALYDKLEKDANDNAVVKAKTVLRESHGNIVKTNREKVVVIDGLDNYIVVDEEDVLIIVPKNKEQDIKKIRSQAQEKYGNHLG